MKILITGNQGYVGSLLTKYLRKKYPDYYLTGLDTGFFSSCLTEYNFLPERYLNQQIFLDMRSTNFDFLEDFDSIVHLAGISNDPIGNFHEGITKDINTEASKKLITKSLNHKIKTFVFASSCSIYGNTGNLIKDENSDLLPLTAYAKSKVDIENFINSIIDERTYFTNLRFATACGNSPRLRLDLVLNDFVTSSILNKQIEILSDGEAMRPLIDVYDMCRAIDWSIHRNILYPDEKNLNVNVGSKLNNFKIKELANLVNDQVKDCEVKFVNKENKDNRSYEVDFSKFENVAYNFNPVTSIEETINNLHKAIKQINFVNNKFRESNFIRLFKIKQLINNNNLDKNFYWIK